MFIIVQYQLRNDNSIIVLLDAWATSICTTEAKIQVSKSARLSDFVKICSVIQIRVLLVFHGLAP
jgi:hypothetical protein